LWISPGGSVEVVESSTRRNLVEKTAAQSEDSTQKVEESLTNQDDVADAVKEDNANDTKLGASASAGAKFAGIYQADASASFGAQTTTKKSSEITHKHSRTQSARLERGCARMEFDSGPVLLGLQSAECRANSEGRFSFTLWKKVADDLWSWLIRYS
jgi:hypothetical protein